MNFFIAKLIFQIGNQSANGNSQFDEQLRLITAYDKTQAFDKAKTLGILYEQERNDNLNSLVRWDFVAITHLYEIEQPQDGAELYFHIHESQEGVGYAEAARLKEQGLLDAQTPIFAEAITA